MGEEDEEGHCLRRRLHRKIIAKKNTSNKMNLRDALRSLHANLCFHFRVIVLTNQMLSERRKSRPPGVAQPWLEYLESCRSDISK